MEKAQKAKTTKATLRVWHIPQVPGKPFHVEVATPEEGAKLIRVLADYDMFQYRHSIKPDYCNASGLEVLENGEWTEWYDDEGQEISDLLVGRGSGTAL